MATTSTPLLSSSESSSRDDESPIPEPPECMNNNGKEPPEEERKTVDSFIRFSWYAVRILLLSEFLLLAAAGNMVYMVYAGAAPKSVACLDANGTMLFEDVCKEHKNDWRDIGCARLEPRAEFDSLNVEFGHFCAETALVKSSISVQMFGVLVGAVIWGHLSDAHGRKKILIICYLCVAALSLLNTLCTDLISFTAVRTILAFFNGGSMVVFGVYKMEHIPTRHRFLVSSLIAWAPNFIMINGLAYLAGDWRTLQKVLFAISAPAIVMFGFCFESPRWLIQHGSIDEARRVLEKIQAIDGVSEAKKEDMMKMMDYERDRFLARERKAKRYNFTHLFRYREMAVSTVIFSFGIMACSMISYGLMFNLEALSGSLFLNSVYLGLLRWSINIVSGILDYNFKCVGRRPLHTVAQGAVGICLLVITFTHVFDKAESYPEVIRVGTLVAGSSISQVFITKGMAAMEYYPTIIRNTAMSFKTTFSRIGLIVAPQMFFLPWSWAPYAILAAMAIVDCGAFLALIPETKGRPLPESLPEKIRKLPVDEEERKGEKKTGMGL